MINLTITSNLTGEVLYTYEGISEEEAEFLVAERGPKAKYVAENGGCPPPCPLNGDCDNCIFFPHDLWDGDEADEVPEWEEDQQKWISENHDRLMQEWEEYSLDY